MSDLLTIPLGPTIAPPARRPGSVRRTSTVLMTWPDGILGGLRLDGRCRDLLTRDDGTPLTLAQHDMSARAALDRTLQSVSADPQVPRLAELAGARAGSALRAALGEIVPEHRDAGTPLYLLLDDLAGASLIAGFVFFRWRDHLPELASIRGRIPVPSMQGICAGFRPGASSLNPDGTMSGIAHRVALVQSLAGSGDPLGWHVLDEPPPMAMRRARRIDVWREDDQLAIDAMFRDSCWEPEGTEIAVHEYHLTATATATDDLAASELKSVVAQPRVLPYAECPSAAANVSRLVGARLGDLRRYVLETLQRTDCCTHLNDALRALAEVPLLAASLECGANAPHRPEHARSRPGA